MRFGACIPNYGQRVSAGELRDFVQEAEGLGYDSLWVTDHVIATPEVKQQLGPQHFDTPMSLLFAGQYAPKARLGFSVMVLPYRDPIVTARVLATLDVLTGGRLVFAVGAGWAQQEFAALGVPFRQRGSRTDEYLKVIKELWTADRAAFHGRYCNFEDVVFEPKPLQKPHPPIWVGGTGTASLERAVRLGDGWHGINLPDGRLEPAVAELRAAAEAAGRAPLPMTLRGMDLEFRERPAEAGQRRPLQGTPEEVLQDVERYDRLGFEELVLHSLRVPTAAEALVPLRQFAREVMPRFKTVPA